MAERTFTYQEALQSFPEVQRLTERAVERIRGLHREDAELAEEERREGQLESATREVIQEWAEAVTALGCQVKGLWLVDWDSGDGYFCWRYPERALAHFHGYEEGFAGRMPVV